MSSKLKNRKLDEILCLSDSLSLQASTTPQHSSKMTTLEPVVSITTALELLSTTPSTAPTPTPAINPLLSRTKPKRPKSKKNSSKASTITLKNLASIDATIASTLDTEEAIDGEGEETDVLDLLDQLDAQRAAEKQAIVDDQFNNAIEDTFDVNKEIKVGRTRESRESVSSVSSGKSAREFLHNFKEDIKERLHMNGSSSSNSNGEKKVSRQQARKVSRSLFFVLIILYVLDLMVLICSLIR